MQLRALVMAYGDISPESPLSLSSCSHQTSSPSTTPTTEQPTPQPGSTHSPSLMELNNVSVGCRVICVGSQVQHERDGWLVILTMQALVIEWFIASQLD